MFRSAVLYHYFEDFCYHSFCIEKHWVFLLFLNGLLIIAFKTLLWPSPNPQIRSTPCLPFIVLECTFSKSWCSPRGDRFFGVRRRVSTIVPSLSHQHQKNDKETHQRWVTPFDIAICQALFRQNHQNTTRKSIKVGAVTFVCVYLRFRCAVVS